MSRRIENPRHSTKSNLPRWKIWCFRLTVWMVLPVLLLVALEGALRLCGFGYPTAFLLPAEAGGRGVWVQNDRFGWRFFPRSMARAPQELAIARAKPANTIRVFVFGESAAYGDPQPAFGLPRMLQAMLHLHFPNTRFEVVNAAMTGINSHTIRDIARDCAKADGDVWVVYMGNNEVVGPFGAGTVFSRQTPPLKTIRAGLALKTTRIGQLFDVARERLHPPAAANSEWGGMMMFLDHAVRSDDPRMNHVYDHFQQNLADIIASGRRAGAGVVVSTVAVNLKDSAPFASSHQPSVTEAQRAQWREIYARGVRAQESGNLDAAITAYDEAARLDDTVAELHFRRGTSALAAGRAVEAQRDFVRARDYDTLRFRCDSQMNKIIRDTAARSGGVLADAEKVMAAQSAGGIAGREFFYEHVHLTWEGSWLLARTLAEQVAKLLPAWVTDQAAARGSWPTPEECARSLGWTDRDRHAALALILGRLHDPPFTQQLDHDAAVRALTAQMEQLAPALQPAGLAAARKAAELAAAQAPEDAVLQAQLADVRRQTGDVDGAIKAARRGTELLPNAQSGWSQLGMLLVQAQLNDEAAMALETALRIDRENVWALNNLAQLHARMGRNDDALREYRRAVTLKPRFGLAHLGIGQILEQRGNAAEADEHYRLALRNRIYRPEELTTLGRFCNSKGWFDAAVTNLQDALRLSPGNPVIHRELAQALTGLDRNGEAEQHRAAAAEAEPTQVETLFLRGLELGRAGKPAEAAEQFREVVRQMPDLVEARLNLGLALAKQGLKREALEQFEQVLQRQATNQMALDQVKGLRESARGKIGGQPTEVGSGMP